MPDNTAQNGTATIATDEVTTLNGTVVSAVHAQRVKVGYGDDGTFRDVTTSFPLPMSRPDGIVTGTITATDASAVGTHGGAGVPLTGTPTAGSYVAYQMLGGESGFTLRLSGTFGGGTVWIESSPDSTNGIDGNWTTNLMRQSGIDTTFVDASITAAGIFRGVAAGYSYLRVRMTGATSPSVSVLFRASAGPSVTALVASIPPGGNQIGTVGYAATATVGTASGNINIAQIIGGTAAVTTNTALIPAPGAGLSIYVTSMEGSNEGAAGTRLTFYDGATARYARFMASAGGGFVTNLTTPWKLTAATALNYQVSVATTYHFTINYYIAS